MQFPVLTIQTKEYRPNSCAAGSGFPARALVLYLMWVSWVSSSMAKQQNSRENSQTAGKTAEYWCSIGLGCKTVKQPNSQTAGKTAGLFRSYRVRIRRVRIRRVEIYPTDLQKTQNLKTRRQMSARVKGEPTTRVSGRTKGTTKVPFKGKAYRPKNEAHSVMYKACVLVINFTKTSRKP